MAPAASSSAANRSAPSPAARGRIQLRDSLCELIWGCDQRRPELGAVVVIERGEGLSAPGVDHWQETVLLGLRGGGHPASKGRERAHRRNRDAAGLREPAGGGDSDSQPREGAGADPDRDPLDRLPAPARLDAALDLREQPCE